MRIHGRLKKKKLSPCAYQFSFCLPGQTYMKWKRKKIPPCAYQGWLNWTDWDSYEMGREKNRHTRADWTEPTETHIKRKRKKIDMRIPGKWRRRKKEEENFRHAHTSSVSVYQGRLIWNGKEKKKTFRHARTKADCNELTQTHVKWTEKKSPYQGRLNWTHWDSYEMGKNKIK